MHPFNTLSVLLRGAWRTIVEDVKRFKTARTLYIHPAVWFSIRLDFCHIVYSTYSRQLKWLTAAIFYLPILTMAMHCPFIDDANGREGIQMNNSVVLWFITGLTWTKATKISRSAKTAHCKSFRLWNVHRPQSYVIHECFGYSLILELRSHRIGHVMGIRVES